MTIRKVRVDPSEKPSKKRITPNKSALKSKNGPAAALKKALKTKKPTLQQAFDQATEVTFKVKGAKSVRMSGLRQKKV